MISQITGRLRNGIDLGSMVTDSRVRDGPCMRKGRRAEVRGAMNNKLYQAPTVCQTLHVLSQSLTTLLVSILTTFYR